jgi:hypothetical protein
MIALSTISMTMIETVSDAKARCSVFRSGTPERIIETIVRRYPKKNARSIDKAIVAPLLRLKRVPNTMPSTSPIEQPVRQCNVALSACRFSEPFCAVCAGMPSMDSTLLIPTAL